MKNRLGPFVAIVALCGAPVAAKPRAPSTVTPAPSSAVTPAPSASAPLTQTGRTGTPAAKPTAEAAASQKTLGSVLTDKDMPVWLSLLLAFGAAIGTYFLAPRITRRLEIGKARSAHVISAINSVNQLIISLNKEIRSFLSAFRLKADEVERCRSNILDIVTEIQWRIIDLKVILKRGADHTLLDELGTKVERLRKSVAALTEKSDQESVLVEVSKLSEALKVVLDRLYREASLK